MNKLEKQSLPNVVVHKRVDLIKRHPDFDNAKKGDIEAALRLTNDSIDINKIEMLKINYPNSIIVPVISIDTNKMNKLPIAYAEVISSITGFKVENIYQINDVSRTNKNAIERLISRAKYTGNVEKGKNYIIVDDVVTQGGTLNELKKYIEKNQGKVVACSTLGYTRYSAVLEIKKETITEIERKFGRDETEKYLKKYGIGERIEDLTNAEGKYICSFKTIERLRIRTIETINGRISKENEGVHKENKMIKKDIVGRIEQLKKDNAEDILKHELNNFLDKENVNGSISTRIKDVEKAIEKMSRKGYTDVKQMTDLVGGKIVTQNVNDIYKLKDLLTKNYTSFEINDFIQNPQNSGYRSLHLDLNIKNQRVEIQIKTPQMDKAQLITHDTLYKNAPNIQELKMPILYLSRNIYDYYTNKNKYFERIDINKIAKNPLVEYIENENQKALGRIKNLDKQRELIDIQEDKFNKARIYLDNIDRLSEVNKNGILGKIFGNPQNKNNNENIKIYKNKLESIGISDKKDYEIQYKDFIKLKDEVVRKIENEQYINREQIKLFNNVRDVVENIEHNEVKERYREIPQAQNWDKDITNKISTLNHFNEKKLSIDDLRGLEKNNQLAKDILKAIDKIFGRDKEITR